MLKPHEKYPHLFSPIYINKLRYPNRIEIAPMGGGNVVECAEFGNSGAAMMTLGSYQIDDEWSMLMGFPNPFDKLKHPSITQKVKGPKFLADQMHQLQKAGMYASVELMHAGRFAHNYTDKTKDGTAIGPITETFFYKRGFYINVIGMDAIMIEHVADNYATAAKKYKEFGFDMIMLHFAHGWLPWQFLSPHFNKRTDEYGGNFENRIRFPKMIIDKVREAVGPDFPIELRIGATDCHEDSIQLDEIIEFLKIVEDKVDLINISAGLDTEAEIAHITFGSNLQPHCNKLHYAAELKKHLHKPIAAVGSIMTPEEAEEAIASGKCDIVMVGKGFLVDPEWAKKAYEGREKDIMHCLRCTDCCEFGEKLGCASNPRYQKYDKIKKSYPKTEHPQHIVVIGGGPAGMHAAIYGAQQGHKVTLFEKSDRLGGQIKNFGDDRFKIDLNMHLDYLNHQIEKYSDTIEVRLNTEATVENVDQCNPDVIIVAVGAVPVTPDYPGIDQKHVIQAVDIFSHPERIKGNVVVLGGASTAIDAAIYAGELGHKVNVVYRGEKLLKSTPNHIHAVKWAINEYNLDVTLNTNMVLKSIEKDHVIVMQNGEEQIIPADTVILATGFKENTEVANRYYDICYKTYKIGDCVKPRTLKEANMEAFNRILGLDGLL